MRSSAIAAIVLTAASVAAGAGWSAARGTAAGPAVARLQPTGDGIDRSALDLGTDACTNFYQHACGGFIASHPATPNRPLVSLAQTQFDTDLQHSLDRLLAEPANGDAELRRLQTFYASCRSGTAGDGAVLKQWLAQIDAARDRRGIQRATRALAAIGVDAFVNYGGRPDRNDLTRNRGEIHYGLLWADRDAVAAAFIASGQPRASAERDADAVVAITTELRKHRNDRWDAKKAENPMTVRQLEKVAPSFAWGPYLAAAGASPGRPINVTSPAYLADLDRQLRTRTPAELRAYLRWALLLSLRGELPASYAPALAKLPVNLRPELGDVNGRCRDSAVRAMGVEFSRQYSKRILGVPARDAALKLSETIRAEIERSIADDDFLSPQARAATLDKLRKTDLKIGFPNLWPDVGNYPLSRQHFLANVIQARRFEQQREWKRASQARSRTAWEMKVSP